MDREGRAVAFLVLEVAAAVSAQSTWPLAARIQPFCDRITVTGSFSIIASMLNSTVGAASAMVVRRRAERGVLGIVLAQRLEVALQPGALARRAVEQLLELVLLGQQLVLLAAAAAFPPACASCAAAC